MIVVPSEASPEPGPINAPVFEKTYSGQSAAEIEAKAEEWEAQAEACSDPSDAELWRYWAREIRALAPPF